VHKPLFFLIEIVLENCFLNWEVQLAKEITHYIINKPEGICLVACTEPPYKSESKVIIQLF